jgi:DNA-binding SARP family transcriptional activator
LLGRYEIELDREPISPPQTAKARSLLAYLALRSDEPIRRETLMSEFWPDADTTSARNNLKTTLSSIRRVFRDHGAAPEAILEITRDVVRWIAPTIVDSREFSACSVDVESERRRATELYSGEFAPGDTNEWAWEYRESLATQFEHLLRADIAAYPTRATAERLLALDPFCDEAYVALIDDALADGNRRSAQAIYRRYAAALAEVDAEPSRDVASRVGLRALPTEPAPLAFCGRTDELAEFERLIDSGTQTIVICGPNGIGKSTFVREAQRRLPNLLASIICATTDRLADVRALYPHAEEIELGPLTYDEVAVGLRRCGEIKRDAIDALWQRSQGYPLVLHAIVSQLDRLDQTDARTIERLRLPRELERHFEEQLRAAGSDAYEVAVLLALEPRLDDDDLAALLNWNNTRVLNARERCGQFGVALSHILEAATRTLSKNRRTHAMQRIAQRLKLHEDPSDRAEAARLLVELGRRSEAARAYLEAARAFSGAAAWDNAVKTVDAGLDALQSLATSAELEELTRELHFLKGRSLYEQGSFRASIHAFEGVLEASDANAHAAVRANALVLMGNALVRMDAIGPAFEIASQAVEEAPPGGGEDLAAQFLMARVFRDQMKYDESIEAASRTFERSIHRREWASAVNSAHMVIDVSRRVLRIDTAFAWAPRLIDAGLLAGPVLEAEARHMYGALRAVMNDLDGALEAFRRALALVEMYRRRRSTSATPVGQLEWMLHYSIAHTHVRTGNIEQAVAESEWLVRSPWMRNSPNCWQGLCVAVSARLAAGTERDAAAARALIERIAPARTTDPRAVLDRVARARFAARCASPDAAQLLRTAVEGLDEVAHMHADQVHPYYFHVAESARGIDDLLSVRATELGRTFEKRLIEAGGSLWQDKPKGRPFSLTEPSL